MAGASLEHLASVAASTIDIMVTLDTIPISTDVTLLVAGSMLSGRRLNAEEYAEALRAQLASWANDGSSAGIAVSGAVCTIEVAKYGDKDNLPFLYFRCDRITLGGVSIELGGAPARLLPSSIHGVFLGGSVAAAK